MNEPATQRPSTTEEAPATPGWVESELDGILAPLASHPALGPLRSAYLDCLAGIGGPSDIDEAHDRCRSRFVRGLETAGVPAAERERLDGALEALEAEISART